MESIQHQPVLLTCTTQLTTVLTPQLKQLQSINVAQAQPIVTSVQQQVASQLETMSSTTGHIRTEPQLPTWLQVQLVDLAVQALLAPHLAHTGSLLMTQQTLEAT